MKTDYATEVAQGRRFEFGKNWARFLRNLDEERITSAVESLREMLEVNDLAGRSFLDIGCGSGLFSLAARRLGATVHSFDFDPHSVACTEELKRRFYVDDPFWTIATGSALDRAYLESLGAFDVVYSWGVLHHTGAMWKALENAAVPSKPAGLLYIAIYNDEGDISRVWMGIKRLYNTLPAPGKFAMALAVGGYFRTRHAIARATRLQNPFATNKPARGMSWFRDVVDWVGGYPFEVAGPDQIFDFYRKRGWRLLRLKTSRGHGCNEFVFRRES